MDYGLIGKIEKAKFYAAEPERIQFQEFNVTVRGDNGSTHTVGYSAGKFTCDCSFFATRGYCTHTMTMERVLTVMLPEAVG